MLLARLFARLIRLGRLTVVDADGRKHVFTGEAAAPAVTIRLHDRSLHWKLALRPSLYAGEAYTDGTLTVENGSVWDFLDLVGRNLDTAPEDPLVTVSDRVDRLMRRFQQFNPVPRARRNACHHYSLSTAFYDGFLDADRQYSCAYFRSPEDSLEAAQEQKKHHIAAKLLLRPGLRVLDIGCGWGGMAMYLARQWGVEVTGITLSPEQLNAARSRARGQGLGDRVRFALRDYREHKETFDRVVSVGMFEHVGVGHYRRFFRALRRLLADDGVALVHTIGRAETPGCTNPWLRKYIFPGGYSPALSEIVPAIEGSGLWITDIEVLRRHYALTLRHWRQRFLANRHRLAASFDERFLRMWEFYLAGCEMSFRYRRCVVFQIQISKRPDSLPLLRDYMFEAERALTVAEPGDRNWAA
jgi:cyclopropane-fatty-acyl-phospholipid synthase